MAKRRERGRREERGRKQRAASEQKRRATASKLEFGVRTTSSSPNSEFSKSHSAQSSPLYAQAQRDLSPVSPGCCIKRVFASNLEQNVGLMAGLISFTIGCRCHDLVLEEVTTGPDHGPGPWLVPPISAIREIKKKYDPLFILVVENFALFSWMSVAHYEKRFPCAIIYSEKDRKGHPDMRSRQFLKKLYAELKLPVLALVSCTPGGLNLLSIHRWGLPNDPIDLTIPDLIWLGVKPTHFDKHGLPEARNRLSDNEMRRIANNLLPQFHKDKEWEDELHCLLRMGVTAGIGDMWAHSPTDGYIPIELENIASSLPE